MYDTGRKVRTCTLFWKVRIIHRCTIRRNFQKFKVILHWPMILRRILKVPVVNRRLLPQICMSEISSSWWSSIDFRLKIIFKTSIWAPILFHGFLKVRTCTIVWKVRMIRISHLRFVLLKADWIMISIKRRFLKLLLDLNWLNFPSIIQNAE